MVHPVWFDGIGWVTSLRIGPKAEEIDRHPYVSLASFAEPLRPAYEDCLARWEDDLAMRREVWEQIKSIPEPLGFDTESMFGSYDYPHLTLLRLKPWGIRLAVAGDPAATRIWTE